MSKQLLIIITTPPTPDCEALEFALAMAAFDHDVNIVFCGDGLFWLQPGQTARKPGGKNPQKLIKALPMYGIESISALNPGSIRLPDNTTEVSQPDIQHWLDNYDTVTF
ncbi:MAG: hypothetical protein CSH36_15440 [Thalassolituus sp.]|jgi:tRNA 2-thiouridine synthesizing protein C|nr:MAG: hypothetical protein CSH36_15440 [Thalassolituus sp.]